MEYKQRTTTPSKTDKNFINTAYGGNNKCVSISKGFVLPNCTGYCWGRWLELGIKDVKLSTNQAEIWFTKSDGYKRGQTPKLGAIVCWSKGDPKNYKDGAGHVAIVEEIYSNNSYKISNSGANSKTFWTETIKNNFFRSGYKFQGFIYPPIEFEAPKENTYTTFVKEVQKACGANVDGKAGPETLSKTITLSKSKNQKHKVVKPLQIYLKSLGYNLGSYGADGCIGNDMTKVIKQYQKDNGCVSDGVITAKQLTWKKLLKLS